MRKNKKGEQKKKKEKLKIQRTLEEQIAKNAEDDKIINQILNQNSSQIQNNNKLYNSFQDNKLENPIRHMNKFDLDYSEINDNYNDNDSQEDSKDSTNELIPSEKCAEKDKKKKNKKENKKNNKKQKKQKKKKGKFKSTAADFKVKYKTELCKYFEINGYCKYGESCAYAHGVENLRSKVTNTTYYRTKKCVQFFEHGYCPYGNRCQFAHQISTNIINNPYDRKMTYKKTLETISKFENIKNIKELIEKPRLSVFKEIVDNKNPIKSTLLEDIKKIRNEGIIERIIDD
jgi:hypothetical protein